MERLNSCSDSKSFGEGNAKSETAMNRMEMPANPDAAHVGMLMRLRKNQWSPTMANSTAYGNITEPKLTLVEDATVNLMSAAEYPKMSAPSGMSVIEKYFRRPNCAAPMKSVMD